MLLILVGHLSFLVKLLPVQFRKIYLTGLGNFVDLLNFSFSKISPQLLGMLTNPMAFSGGSNLVIRGCVHVKGELLLPQPWEPWLLP